MKISYSYVNYFSATYFRSTIFVQEMASYLRINQGGEGQLSALDLKAGLRKVNGTNVPMPKVRT